MTHYPIPKPNAWKIRDNCILIDTKTWDYSVHNRTRGKMRLFLGEVSEGEFQITLPTIKVLSGYHADLVRKICAKIVADMNKNKRKIMQRRLAS